MNNKKLNVYVVGPSSGYARFIKDYRLVSDIAEADVVVLTGGADINPAIYGKAPHETTWWSESRDAAEIAGFKATRPDQVIVGICRGAQLACALYGGILIQDVSGHCGCGSHRMSNADGVTYPVVSIHHQMLYPWDLPDEDYDVLFWADHLSRRYLGDGVDENVVNRNCEPEVTVFHREGLPTCLAIQGHPEMMGSCPTVDMVNDILNSLLDGTYQPTGKWVKK